MSDYDFTNEEYNRMGDILLAELAARENGPISEAFAKKTIARQNILTESVEMLNENASSTYYEYHNHGVTVTRDKFEKVYTNPDMYPTTHDILRALSFPEEILRRPVNSLRKQLVGSGWNPRKSSMLGWYNTNSSPAHRLVPPQYRKEEYSRAAKIRDMEKGKEGGERVTPSAKQIDAGKRTVNNRTSKVVDDINQQDIFAGEFYNNRSKIPRKNWNHWLKFWDRRMSSVEPNKKKALGNLIGRTWGKTFLLGYQVDRSILYEIWYNSMDSSFSVYDMHGVEMGNPTPTLQEAIRDLIHVIAQVSDTDKANFGVGRTGADLAASLKRTLGNVMSQDVGVMKREQELRTKEVLRQAKDEAEEKITNGQKKQKQVDRSHGAALKMDRKNRYSREYDMMRQYANETTIDGIKNGIKHAKDQLAMVDDEDSPAGKYWQDQMDRLNAKLKDAEYQERTKGFTGPTPTEKKKQEKPEQKKQTAEPKRAKRSEEEERVDQYDRARMTKMGQETMDKIQRNMANRQLDLEIEQRKNDMERLRKDIEAAWHNAEANDIDDLEPLNPKYGIDPTRTIIRNDGSMNPEYRELAVDLEKQYRAYEDEVNQKQSFKKKEKKKKRGLGDMPWQSPRQRGIKEASEEEDSFLKSLFGDEAGSDLPKNPHMEIPEIDDSKIDREARQVKQQAENSPYNRALLMSDVTGSLKSYDKTKIRQSSIAAVVGNWVRDKIAPTRSKGAQGIRPGFWSRAKMFFRGQHFRADFIIGWSFADRLNLEIWYVTEPDPENNSRLISSFYVYDVNAKMVIRKYVPYYRIAVSTVSAKLGVA